MMRMDRASADSLMSPCDKQEEEAPSHPCQTLQALGQSRHLYMPALLYM